MDLQKFAVLLSREGEKIVYCGFKPTFKQSNFIIEESCPLWFITSKETTKRVQEFLAFNSLCALGWVIPPRTPWHLSLSYICTASFYFALVVSMKMIFEFWWNRLLKTWRINMLELHFGLSYPSLLYPHPPPFSFLSYLYGISQKKQVIIVYPLYKIHILKR